jgi:hypothetical protein
VVVAAVLGGLIVVGIGPFDLQHPDSSVETLALVVIVDVVLAALAILKGKPLVGLVGIFLPIVSLVGVLRLASPGSPWARWWYPPESKRRRRSEARWERIKARRKRVSNLIAGAPETQVAIDD